MAMMETESICSATCASKPFKQEPRRIRVCFVCTGNTCRSPMAAAVANAWEKRLEAQAHADDRIGIEAISAGLYAFDGDPISAHAEEALTRAGIEPIPGHDYRTHTAHTITAEEAERADLLVGLSGGHCMELMLRFPQAASRIVSMPRPISDPYGGDLAVYERCLAEITEGVLQLLYASAETEEKGDGHEG